MEAAATGEVKSRTGHIEGKQWGNRDDSYPKPDISAAMQPWQLAGSPTSQGQAIIKSNTLLDQNLNLSLCRYSRRCNENWQQTSLP